MALSTGIIPGYINALVRSTLRVATSHIVTEKDLSKNLFSFCRDVIRQLELLNPDIVHIHACWDFRSALVEKIARKKGYFTIVSPHGGLSPEQMEVKFWKERLPRILLYQLKMIRKCDALVLTSEKEQKDMAALRWKQHVALIPHPLTNDLSDDDISTLIMSAYRKVIDTNYKKRLTAEEEVLINNCLKASVWKYDTLPADLPNEIDTSAISFRRMYLYAHDQNVTEEFINGAHRLKVNIPPKLDVDRIPRFKLKEKQDKKSARKLHTLVQILSKLIDEENVKVVSNDSLRSLLTIYTLLRFNDYDEDKFNILIKKQGIESYTRKLMKQLSELFQLELGFMPILPHK